MPSGRDYVLLLLLGATWGGSFFLIKVAVATIPPLSVAAGRIAIGAAALGVMIAARGGRLPSMPSDWAKLWLMGTLGTVLPFALISWGETRITSGLAAIMMSAVPLSTILLAHFAQRDEPLTFGKIAALVFGGAGILVLVGPDALAGLGDQVLGQAAILAAGLCYAVNSVTARRLSGLSPEIVSFSMLLAASVVAVPLSLAVDRPWRLEPSALSLLAVAGLGLLSTALGYILMFRIIASAGAGFASFNNYLVPLFGVFWGMALLGESLQPQALFALVLIFLGLAAPRLKKGRRF